MSQNKNTRQSRRVVVTGMGTISPVGNNVGDFWDSLKNGRTGVGPITRFDAAEFESRVGAEVKGFDPKDFMGRKDARKMALFSQYAAAAAREALEASGLRSGETINSERLGVLMGNGIGGIDVGEESMKKLFEEGPRRMFPMTVPMMIANEAAGNISMMFGAQAPSWTMVTACASGTDALGLAIDSIRLGRADAMIAGGTEACLSPFPLGGFCRIKALSTQYNDQPEKASRPFAKDRDGFLMGEGAGILILESEEHALARGADILAEAAGYGATSDAYHITAPDPAGTGGARAIRLALEDAGMTPEDVDYFNAHGTSTPINDPTETKAIKTAFGTAAAGLAVSSTKSMTGHCIGAAGGMEAIASVMAIREGFIPPTVNLDEPDPACDLDYVPNRGREQAVRSVLSSSLGFGGHNGILALRRYEG